MQRSAYIDKFFDTAMAMRRHMMASHAHGKQLPSPAQLGMLFAVAHNKEPSIKTLAQSFCMTSSAATQLVNGLVDDGLLARKTAKDDRRKISLALTRKGKALVERAKNERHAMFTKLLEPLSDSELSTLCALQDKILANLRTV